jgi:hypothetical protein
VVELVANKLVVAPVGGWNDKERERKETGKVGFWPTLDPNFFLLRP